MPRLLATCKRSRRSAILQTTCFAAVALTFAGASPAWPAKPGYANRNADPVTRAVEMYCTNMRDKALDARFLKQKKLLADLESEIKKKAEKLAERTELYRKWYELRRKFIRQANATLVGIYSNMRPDSAAAQLVKMDELTAASLLLKLTHKRASAILNEMDPTIAARLASTLVDAAGPSGQKGGT